MSAEVTTAGVTTAGVTTAGVVGVARRRFLRDLEHRLAEPAARLVLHGPDADLIADALVLAWPRAIEVSAHRRPYAWMRALAARLGIELSGGRRDDHRALLDAWRAQSELVVVRDARRLDAESALWLDSLAGLDGPSVLVVDDDAAPIAGYGLAQVPHLDHDAIAEWCMRPEVVRRLVDASSGSVQSLSTWLVGGTAVDPRLARAAETIAAADGIDPEALFRDIGVRASDGQWAGAGVRFVRGELRSSSEPSREARDDHALRAWARGDVLDAMHRWSDEPFEAHLDDALRFLSDAPACAAELLSRAEPTAERMRRRTELLCTIGRWGEARDAAHAWHERHPSDDAAFELARLRLHTGRASDARAVLGSGSARWRALGAEIEFQLGRHEHAAAEARWVLDAPGVETETRLSAMQTWAKVAVNDDAESLRRYDEYADAAAHADDARHASYAASGRAVALIRMRRLDDAIASLRRGAELAEQADDTKARALAHHNLAVALHLQDRYAEARRAYEVALRWLRALSHTSSMARCAYNLGELYEQLGAHTRALKMGELGAQLGGADATPAAQAEGALLRARALLALERFEAADAALQSIAEPDLLDRSRRAGLTILHARIDTAAGRAQHALKRLDAIDVDALPASRRAELEVARTEALRAFHGRLGRELDAAQSALAWARKSGSRHWILEALRVVIDASRAHGNPGTDLLAEARAIERELARAIPPDLAGAWEARRREVPIGPEIIGRSARLHEALELARRVAPTRCTVLLRGESGTGKELLAEAIHRASGRGSKPLVRVSCAALVESLLLSELFGHERGAFTGATERRRGRFELADGGTLFLDEVGELSPTVQAALLRVLQDRTFERVGGSETITVDVRVIAATHRDLEAMVREGTFRADLYYRLAEVGVELPPLRERRDDVPLLVDHVLRRIAREQGVEPKVASPGAMRRLRELDWPGNVRQLENMVQAAALFAFGPVLEPNDFDLPRERSTDASSDEATVTTLVDDYARLTRGEISLRDLKKELERRCVVRALAECEGNITKAAELLGMKRPRVSQLLKEYGLRSEPDEWKEKR